MTTDPTDNAFPVVDSDGAVSTAQSGLTKREYFAAIAMQGLMAMQTQEWHCDGPEDLVQGAVDHADALIAALNGEGQSDA